MGKGQKLNGQIFLTWLMHSRSKIQMALLPQYNPTKVNY